jgi:hypothetical protein
MAGPGLYANIHAKRKRGGKMRKKGAKGAPTPSDEQKSCRKKFIMSWLRMVSINGLLKSG